MKRLLMVLALSGLALGSAYGFEETAPVSAPTTGAAAAPEAALADPKAPVGTEIKVPGLGSIGVLPKLDFGLELLYGAADKPELAGEGEIGGEGTLPEPGEFTVRGELKHQF